VELHRRQLDVPGTVQHQQKTPADHESMVTEVGKVAAIAEVTQPRTHKRK
jgi:hypothetical protein